MTPITEADVSWAHLRTRASLRCYIEAVGGKPKIVAEFPEGEIAITNYSDVGDVKEATWVEGGGEHP